MRPLLTQQKVIFKGPVYLSLIFGIIFALVSLPNYYLFRSATLDLGLYTNALYDYAHFSFHDSASFKEHPVNLLSDHFDLFLILVSPLSWIFRNWTLLFVQIFFLLAGGWGVYTYLRDKIADQRICLLGMTFFYLQFSVFSALSFDFHSNVIAASVIPWFFVFLQRGHVLKSWLLLLFILICKENMALWMFFVCLGAVWMFRKNKFYKVIVAMAGFSILYFFLITAWVMPGLSEEGSFIQFKYSVLGANYSEAFQTLIHEPLKLLCTLFVNHSGDPMGDYVKSECWLFFLFAGGVVLLLRPVWLFLLIPIFLQKFLHDNIQMWGVNDQYVIEFAPVIAMGVFDVIGTLQLGKARMPVAVIILLMTTGTTIRLMDRTSARVPKVNVRIYQAAHWQTSLPLDEIREAMAFIPDESTVSGQSFLLPHLAWRDKIYMFPMVKDAEYIFYTRGYNTYPVSEVEFNKSVNFLENNFGEWELVYIAKEVRLLKRK